MRRVIKRGPKGKGSNLAAWAKRRERVAELLKQKLSYREIAEIVGVSKATIAKDVEKLFEEWRDIRVTNVQEIIMLEVAHISYVIKEAKEQWEASKTRVQTEKTYGPAQISKRSKNPYRTAVPQEIKQKTLLPERGYLETILNAGERLTTLVGGNAPKKVDVTVDQRQEIDKEYHDKPDALLEDARKLLAETVVGS